jgi:3-methylcrotonyl-CoA carboxylase beta subunit
MEGDSAVQALYSVELEKLKKSGEPVPAELADAIRKTREDYERWLDAKYAAARGHCDAIIDPKETREILTMALEVAMHHPRAGALALETL